MKRKITASLLVAVIMIISVFQPLNTRALNPTSQLLNDELAMNLTAENIPECLNLSFLQDSGHVSRLIYDEDMNTAVFSNGDGTNTMYLFDEPIKYIDASGKIKDKKSTLVKQSDGSYRNIENDISVTYSNDIIDGISLNYQNFTLSMTPQTDNLKITSTGIAKAILSDEKTINYVGTFGKKTNLQYVQNLNGFKENIIISSESAASATYRFTVETLNLTITDINGRITALDSSNNIVGYFGDVYAYDAANNYTFGDLNVSEIASGEYLLEVSIPEEFLNNTNTIYPVVIDPTFTVTTSSTNKTIEDATIFTNYQTKFGTWHTLFVGNYDSWKFSGMAARGTARTLIRFPGLYRNNIFSLYNKAARIEKVKLVFTDIDGLGGPTVITAHSYNQQWNENNVIYSSTLWNDYNSTVIGKVTITPNSSGSSTKTTYEIEITNAVKRWASLSDAETRHCGVLLKAQTESSKAVCIGSSEIGDHTGDAANKPYLSVTYKAMPTVETAGITSGVAYNMTCRYTSRSLAYSSATSVTQSATDYKNRNQKFIFTYVGNGRYKISPATNPSLFLTYDGTNVTLAPSNDSSLRQCWHIVSFGLGFYIYHAVNTNKLLSFNNSTTAVTCQTETNHSGWNFTFTNLNVPLEKQQTSDTCGTACAVMMLHYYGYNSITQAEFKSKAGAKFTELYTIKETINYYLNKNNAGFYYVYGSVLNYTLDEYISRLQMNIDNNHPALIKVVVNDTNYFPYTTGGHYVVLTGIYYNSLNSTYMAVVNDPHYNYLNEITMPVSALFEYNKNANAKYYSCVDHP